MLIDNPRAQWWLRWFGIPPVALIAVFLAFNLVTPFRLINKGLWPSDVGPAAMLMAVVVDALLMLAPLMVVVVFTVWLMAPCRKVAALRVGEGVLAAGCLAALAVPLLAGNWHGGLVLGFGALATVISAGALVRYERRQAGRGAEQPGAADSHGA